jgi:DNA processing protein
MTEAEAYVGFNLTEKIGIAGVKKLISKFGDVVSAWENYPKKVARSGGVVDIAKEYVLAHRYGVKIVTVADAAYPKILQESPGCPLVLYVKGDETALSRASISIVGTRRNTPYGHDMAYNFAKGLAEKGYAVVSGLALGTDAEAHRGALDAGGVTVGVLGSGLDKFYPEENRTLAREMVEKGGAVVSQFAFGREPDTHTFPIRNHVVAALGRGTLAIEAPLKSGTLITTGIAADLGRVVMAVPHRIDNRMGAGCNNLIRNGATMVLNVDDVIEAISSYKLDETISSIVKKEDSEDVAIKKRVKIIRDEPVFSVEEALIIKNLDETGVSIDELAMRSHFSIEKVNTLTMTLRIKGRIRFLPGNRVALVSRDFS